MVFLARRFRTGDDAHKSGQSLPYPICPCPVIALCSSEFASAPPVIRIENPGAIAASGAQTVAAPLAVLYAIDALRWRPEYPIVVLSQASRGLIAEEDRDRLWERFGVPVFEYLLSAAGNLVAEECEAHEGLHLSGGCSDLRGTITREPCACGKSTPRLLTLDAIIEESLAVPTLKQEWRNWQTHQT